MDNKKMYRILNFLTEGEAFDPKEDIEDDEELEEGFGDGIQKGYYKLQQKRHTKSAMKAFTKASKTRHDEDPTPHRKKYNKGFEKAEEYSQKADAVDKRRKRQQNEGDIEEGGGSRRSKSMRQDKNPAMRGHNDRTSDKLGAKQIDRAATKVGAGLSKAIKTGDKSHIDKVQNKLTNKENSKTATNPKVTKDAVHRRASGVMNKMASHGEENANSQWKKMRQSTANKKNYEKLNQQREHLSRQRENLEHALGVNAQDPRWGIVEGRNSRPEIQPAIDTVDDIYTMLDIAFDDAQSAIAAIDGKDARSFQQAMDMVEKASDHMMKILKKYK